MEQQLTPSTGSGHRIVTIILALSMLLASLGTSIANIALPALVTAFSAPFPMVQGVVVAYLGALVVSTVVAGRLGDRYGLKPMLVTGLGLFSVASLICALAPGLWSLIGARALQGVGAAFLMTLSMALMRETASEARLGRAMGLLGTVSAFGTALGPSAGGLLISYAGWRGIFIVQVPLSLLALLLAATFLPATGSRAAKPASSAKTLLNGGFPVNLAINVLVAAVMMTTLVVGPFYLATSLGLSAALVGGVMSLGPVISIASGVPAGRAVDRWGAQPVLGVGLTLLALGALLIATLPPVIGLAGYVAAIALLTPGYQLFQAANNTSALADVPKERRGLASGLLSLSRNAGLIAGASVMGAVFMFGTGTGDFAHAPPDAIEAGMRLTFFSAAAMMMVAMGLAFGKHAMRKFVRKPAML